MPIRWNPTGNLDVATDPQDLPSQASGNTEVSGSMTRCTNLHLDRVGMACTRRGSRKLNSVALSTPVWELTVQNGVRYAFGGKTIYQNEMSIGIVPESADWSILKYNAWTSSDYMIFATNGISRKRIDHDGSVWEWGIDSPSVRDASKQLFYAYTNPWEHDEVGLVDKSKKQITTETLEYHHLYDWEKQHIEVNESVWPDSEQKWIWMFESPHFGVSLAGDGNKANDYFNVYYTFCRKNGNLLECESNPSEGQRTRADSGMTISWNEPADDQITHVRIYRTLTEGATICYDSEWAVGDHIAAFHYPDTGLGAELEWDHDRPPLGVVNLFGPNFNGSCFAIAENKLYYCQPKQAEYWPALQYIEVGTLQDPIIAGTFFNGSPYVASNSEIWMIQGTTSFIALPMAAKCGTFSKHCFAPVKGQGIFHLGTDGIYLFSTGSDQKVSDECFDPIFRGDTIGSIPGINRDYLSKCRMIQTDSKLWFGYPGGDATEISDFLVWDLDVVGTILQPATAKAVHYQYGATQFTALCADEDNARLIAADTNGYIWSLDDKASPFTDEGDAINWQVESKEFNGLRKYFPRYARWDVELDSGAAATGSVLLDNVIKQNHTIVSRNTKKRHVTECTGDRISLRVAGTGNAKIYGAECE